MTREIKFRAWDGEKMINVYQMQFQKIGIVVRDLQGKRFNSTEIIKLENPILMQYTGLKDKNGKEIFEGDIVSWPARRMECEQCETKASEDYSKFCADCGGKIHTIEEHGGQGEITFSDGAFKYFYKEDDDWGYLVSPDEKIYRDKVEVLGNIHENPELLN